MLSKIYEVWNVLHAGEACALSEGSAGRQNSADTRTEAVTVQARHRPPHRTACISSRAMPRIACTSFCHSTTAVALHYNVV
jgi:hypothetical protein